MTLRDRIRRWRSPAQWEDDHPAERKQREQRKKGGWFTKTGENLDEAFNSLDGLSSGGHTDYERDFKKPR